MSNYRELPPPANLARYVSCLWRRHTTGSDRSLQPRILPDGCIDIVWIGANEPVVAGPATKTVTPRLPVDTPIAGVRFRPGTAPRLLGLPASEIRDVEVRLADIWNTSLPRLADATGANPSTGSMLAALTRELQARIPDAGDEDRIAVEAAAIVMGDPATRVGRLSAELGLSERQLRRRFEAAVGYGPKMLGRVMRLQRALRIARDEWTAASDLAMLATLAGYADQAHMTREFSILAGQTPAKLLKSPGPR